MTKPLALDFFCCQGAASKGYADAGFEVIGIDVFDQLLYPYQFIKGDAIALFEELVKRLKPQAVVGSPPCQAFSATQRIQGRAHPRLIAPFRELCEASGLPYVIENVEDARAELKSPITLCGAMFPGLNTYRHRLFESNVTISVPEHPQHTRSTVKMGRPLMPGDWYHAVGNFSGVDYVRKNMGVPWMTRDGIRECIPPVYAEYIGRQLIAMI
jgi:DNA (cytosine-5)-methyltransferase 1